MISIEPPKLIETLKEAAEPKSAVVVPLFPVQPAIAVVKEIPAYLRFPDPKDYSKYQYGVQLAELEANLAALKGKTTELPPLQYQRPFNPS